MKFFLAFCFFFSLEAFCRPQIIFLHGLNANVDSITYTDLKNYLSTKGDLNVPKLPGHIQKNQLAQINLKNLQSFLDELLASTFNTGSEEVILIAHSMAAVFVLNHLTDTLKNKFKKIIYLSPAIPPKYFSFFQTLLHFLPNNFPIPSYSPKNLRLNDSLIAKNYDMLFSEVMVAINRPFLQANEVMIFHELDEVIDVVKFSEIFSSAKRIKGVQQIPYHVFFLETKNQVIQEMWDDLLN